MLGAGFYADILGPLPFVVGKGKCDCCALMELMRGYVITQSLNWIAQDE